MEKAQSLLDAIPNLIDKKKISGKDLPTEVFIKKNVRHQDSFAYETNVILQLYFIRKSTFGERGARIILYNQLRLAPLKVRITSSINFNQY